MNNNEQDRRILKTREAIQDALYSLMSEKQYNKITIQNIIDRANVGRSTFYSHFATKDELLLSSVEHFLQILNDYIKSYFESEGEKARIIPVVELFEHIKQNSRVIKGMYNAESSELFFERVQRFWNSQIEEYLSSKQTKGKKLKVPIEVLTNHISSTFIYMLKWWVDNKMPYSPIEMDQYFQELINPCIHSIME